MKKELKYYCLINLILLIFIGCNNQVERFFFPNVNFNKRIDNDNWWTIDSLGTQEKDLNVFKFNLKILNLEIKDSYCAMQNDCFYIGTDRNNLKCFFDFVGKDETHSKLIGQEGKTYFFLYQSKFEIDHLDSELSVWAINRNEGIIGLAYVSPDSGEMISSIGDMNKVPEMLTLLK